MAFTSGSDRSNRSSIYWGSNSSSESLGPAEEEIPSIGSSNTTSNTNTNPPRPRLSSPRIFREFFTSNTLEASGARDSARLPPATAQTNVQDFPRAFENVNRAVQTAHQAFQSPPVVDLTNSPPPRRESPPQSPMYRRRYHSSSPPPERTPPHPPPGPLYQTRFHRSPPPVPYRTHQSLAHGQPSTEGRARKRRRLDIPGQDTFDVPSSPGTPQEVEAVDLTGVNNEDDLLKALAKQRQDAITAQMKQDRNSELAGRTALSSYKCPICMDTPENATTTICGHLFCHKCIIDTLRWSEEQRQDEFGHGKVKGTCPVCRKPLARTDKSGTGRALVPLELKITVGKRIDKKGKGVDRDQMVIPHKERLKAEDERESSTDMWRELTCL